MDIIKAHAVKNLCYIAAQPMTPAGIVVHSTGANNPSLKRYVDCPGEVGYNRYGNHWNNPTPGGRKVCVHAFIGYDKNKNVRVAEILPLNICCWGVGSGKNGSYNFSPAYIQFEICEDGRKDETYYREAFSAAAEYTAYLCRTYHIPIECVVSHKEAHQKGYGCNHGDPEHWMKNFSETMDDFRKTVRALLCADAENAARADGASIGDGDLVSLSSDAMYCTGKSVPDWVKRQRWYVRGTPEGDRVVIDKNEAGTNSICSAVDRKYLTVIQRADSERNKNNV